MKTLRESLLDIDFDVEDQTIFLSGIKDFVIDLIKNSDIDNIDEKYEEAVDILNDIAETQRGDSSSIMKKLRMKDSTAIYAVKLPYPDKPYKICVRRFIRNPRPTEIVIELRRTEPNSSKGYASIYRPHNVNHLTRLSPKVCSNIVFMNNSVWDDIVDAL